MKAFLKLGEIMITSKKDRCKALIQSYSDEYKKHGHCLPIPREDSITTILLLSAELCKMEFNKAIVEFIGNQAIRFTFLFDRDIMLLITVPLIKGKEWRNNDMVYSVFTNRELLACDTDCLKEFIPKFNEFLSQ